MHHPCRTCGACCAHPRVTFDEDELASRGGTVPDRLTVPFKPGERAMKGSAYSGPGRCIALEGSVGEWVTCSIYADRCSTCRVFRPSFEDGQRSPPCDLAREVHGLLPLTDGVWDRYRQELRPILLEKPTRFSQSLLWRLQREFFATAGPTAWRDDIVPSGVSTNAKVAASYAHLIVAFLRDCCREGNGLVDPTQPLYVIELGSGTGRLAYLLARALARLEDETPSRAPPICVVATDFTEANLDWMQAHPSMQSLVEDGRIDFAPFDADTPSALDLRHSGERLEPGSARNPVVVVANYVFDSLPTDAFHVRDGQLYHALVAVSRKQDARGDPHRLEQYHLQVDERAVAGEPYDDPLLNEILEAYRRRLRNTGLWLPVGSIAVLRFLKRLSEGPMLLLVGDKCFRTFEELEGRPVGWVATHGSVSVTVNANALERVVEHLGGFAVHADSADTAFTLSTYVLPGRRDQFPETRFAFRQGINAFGPREAHLLSWSLRSVRMPAVAAIQVIRAIGCDSWSFKRYFPTVVDALSTNNDREFRKHAAAILDRVAENDYWLGEKGTKFAFLMGQGYQAVDRLEEAARWYRESLERDGPSAQCWFNLAACQEQLDRGLAASAYQEVLALDPAFAGARERLARLVAETREVADGT